MSLDQILLFVAAGLLLNLTPGPDVLYIVSHALRGGARAGMVAALGIAAGCFVHIVAAAVGVSALMAASATAFTVLKWLGAVYLVEAIEHVKQALGNIAHTTQNLDTLMGSQRKNLSKIISNVESISSNLKQNNDQITNILSNFSITDSISSLPLIFTEDV